MLHTITSRFLLLLIFFSCSAALYAQPVLRIGRASSCTQDTVGVPVIAENFVNIGAVSLTIRYNPDSLEYLGYSYSYVGAPLIVNSPFPGLIISSWYSLNGINISSADYHVLNFRAILPGSAQVYWDTLAFGGIEIADASTGDLVPISALVNGGVDSEFPLSFIQQPPLSAQVSSTGSVVITAGVSGNVLAYQWQYWNGNIWEALQDGGAYAGVNTANLSVNGAFLTGNVRVRLLISGAHCTTAVVSNETEIVLSNCTMSPVVFASDTLLHCGDSLVLDAGAGFDRYEWSTSDTTQTLTVRYTGWYRCRVFDGPCSVEDSVFVSIINTNLYVESNLVCIGGATMISLQGFNQGVFGALQNSNSHFSIRLTVDMSQYPGSIASNGIRIGGNLGNVGGTINGVLMSIWNPTSPECALEPVGNSLWTQEIVFPVSALGEVVQFKFVNGNWGSNENSVNLSECGLDDGFGSFNRSISLERNLSLLYCYDNCTNCDRGPAIQYPVDVLWSTGDTTASITVLPAQTTTYYVTVSNGIHSCTDSVIVNVLPNPLAPNLFASDTLLHCGDSLVLDAGAGFDRYEWSTSDTTRTNTVRNTGWYRCRVFDGLCSVEDSVFVSIIPEWLPFNDTSICSGSAIELNPNTLNVQQLATINNLTIVAQTADRAYLLGPTPILWTDANQLATNMGVELYCIKDAVEEELVYNSLPWRGNDGIHYWLGLYQDHSDPNYSEPAGGWKWVDGSPLTYTNWESGEPNNSGGEDYAHFEWLGIGKSWNDAGLPALNGTELSYPIYEVAANQFIGDNFTFLWSTGDTTASITVSPTQTTTYYVTISNGIHSCVDSVTVEVQDAARFRDQTICLGDTTEIPLTVTRLNNIAAISLAMDFDTTNMTYVGYSGLHPELSSAQIGSYQGQVRIGWFGSTPVNLTNDTLVNYRFVFTGPAQVSFNTSDPANCEIVDNDLNIVPFCLLGGTMQVAPTVQILSVPTGPFDYWEGDSVVLSILSDGAIIQSWERFDYLSGLWMSLGGMNGFSGVSTGSLRIDDIAYSRPGLRLRLRLNNGCDDFYSPEFFINVRQRIWVEMGSSTICSGDTALIPIRVWGAREVSAISMSVLVDPGLVSFTDWILPHVATQSSSWINGYNNGDIRLSWYSLQPASLEDGDTLGFLRLVANGTTPLQWDLVNQGNNELADSTGQVVECSYVGGQLSVLPLPEPILLSSSLAFCQGDSVTLSIQDASGAIPQGWVYEWYRDGLLLSGVVGVQHIALQGGRYRVRVTNADGCSRLTSEVEVLVNLPSNTTLNEVICAPSSFIVGGQGFQSAGVYQVNLTNYLGCDSLITLNLTVNEPSASTMSQTICAPNGYSFNGQWLTTTGVYLDTLINGLGCDSLVTLDLTVNQPSQIAIFDTLCAPNCYVVGGQTFCASGSYTVTLTNVLGCDSVITLNLTVNNCNRITGVLRYKNNAQTPMSRSYVKLTDFNGNVVAGDSTDLGGNFDLSGYPSGSYTLSGASSIQWGGVNATDGVLIQRSYTTILPLTGLNLLAADVNASGVHNLTDAVIVARRYSTIIFSFPAGNWCVENVSVNANGLQINQDLRALCYGDVNGSNTLTVQRQGSGLNWGAPRGSMVWDEISRTASVPVFLSGIERVGALSIELAIPPGVRVVDVRSKLDLGYFTYGILENVLRIGWFDMQGYSTQAESPIFELVLAFDQPEDMNRLEQFPVLPSTEIADELGTVLFGADLHMPLLRFPALNAASAIRVYPNPSSGFYSVEGAVRLLRLTDLSGREIANALPVSDGNHIDLRSAADGVYLLELESSTGREVHKLIKRRN